MVSIDKDELSSIFDTDPSSISMRVAEDRHSLVEEPLEKLYENEIITSESGTKITVEAKVDGDTVCEIDYMIFDDIGYIHWTSVPEEYQSQGVATIIRRGVVDDIINRGVTVIYSYPASETGLLLAKKQGFTETSDLSHGFGTWLKREV